MSERDEFGGYTERDAREIAGLPVSPADPDAAVIAAHVAICEDSIEECLEYRGRCVKATEAAAPYIAARALEDAADAVDEAAERLKLNKAAVSSDWIRNRAAALRGEA